MEGPVAELTSEPTLFVRMAREYPVRTLIFSLGLPVFALIQLLNAYLNQGALLATTTLSVLTVAFTIRLTQYQLAVYRRRSVGQWAGV